MDEEAQRLVDGFLARLDAATPGVIEGVYLIGSLALDDFRPGVSDIDFLALCAAPDEAAALTALRAGCGAGARFDGMAISRADLAGRPDALVGPRAVVTDRGAALVLSCGARNPVAWATLLQGGIVARGPALADLTVWANRARLASFVRENAESYWRALWARSRAVASPAWWRSHSARFVAWSALGVARLQYTQATGRIASKTDAGVYARQVFAPRWADLIDAALAIRAGFADGTPRWGERRAETLAFMDVVLETLGA